VKTTSFVLILGLLLAGCTRNAARRSIVIAREQERTRELIQGAKLANQVGRERLLSTGSNAVGSALVAYDLSSDLLGRGQSVLGLPVVDQSALVASLLSSNRTLRASAASLQRRHVVQEQAWAIERAEVEAKLFEMGQKYEAARNRSIVHRFWGWLVSSIGVGGIIALCVFFPALIPIFGRLLGWVVSKIPALAGAVGVVSTKAYDAVVRGVENAKKEWGRSDAEAVLHKNLSQEMDESHKRLVRVRKAAVA
jgi:hypothetical protein